MAEVKNVEDTNTETEVVEATIQDGAVEETVKAIGATDVVAVIEGLNNPESAFYSSIVGTSHTDRLAIAKAMTTSLAVDDNLIKPILLANFIVQQVSLSNDKGEINIAPRVLLIDADGTAYHATSIGLLSSISNILSVMGQPSTWDAPILCHIEEQRGRSGFKFFTIKFD